MFWSTTRLHTRRIHPLKMTDDLRRKIQRTCFGEKVKSGRKPETIKSRYSADQEGEQQNDPSPDPKFPVVDQDVADKEKVNCEAVDALSDSSEREMCGQLFIDTSCNSSPQSVASDSFSEHGAVPESSRQDQRSPESVPTRTESRQGVVSTSDFDSNSFEKKPRNRVFSSGRCFWQKIGRKSFLWICS
eukprot:scpid73587/ scgid14477/ 